MITQFNKWWKDYLLFLRWSRSTNLVRLSSLQSRLQDLQGEFLLRFSKWMRASMRYGPTRMFTKLSSSRWSLLIGIHHHRVVLPTEKESMPAGSDAQHSSPDTILFWCIILGGWARFIQRNNEGETFLISELRTEWRCVVYHMPGIGKDNDSSIFASQSSSNFSSSVVADDGDMLATMTGPPVGESDTELL